MLHNFWLDIGPVGVDAAANRASGIHHFVPFGLQQVVEEIERLRAVDDGVAQHDRVAIGEALALQLVFPLQPAGGRIQGNRLDVFVAEVDGL